MEGRPIASWCRICAKGSRNGYHISGKLLRPPWTGTFPTNGGRRGVRLLRVGSTCPREYHNNHYSILLGRKVLLFSEGLRGNCWRSELPQATGAGRFMKKSKQATPCTLKLLPFTYHLLINYHHRQYQLPFCIYVCLPFLGAFSHQPCTNRWVLAVFT